jgi:ligand-binding sensor domain-containing protein
MGPNEMIACDRARVSGPYFAVLALLPFCVEPECKGLDAQLQIEQYQKQHWEMEGDSPHNYVFIMLHVPDGYLLVGTDEGLARFDGMRFSLYDLDSSINLSKQWILFMSVGRDGSIGTRTFDGGLYQWRSGKVGTRFDGGSSILALVEVLTS